MLLGDMMFRVWVSGGYEIVEGVANSLTIVPGGAAGVEAIAVFGLGLYLAFLFLFVNDFRKLYQGYLLIAATSIVLGTLWYYGIFLPNIDLTLTNGFWFLVGVTIAAGLEAAKFDFLGFESDGDLGEVTIYDSNFGAVRTDDGLAEFPIATTGLYVIITLVVLTGDIAAFLVGIPPGWLVVYVLATLVFLRALRSFMSIDMDPDPDRLEILGPESSGKTTAMFGLFRTARDQIQGDADLTEEALNLNPNPGMQALNRKHSEWTGDGWPWDRNQVAEGGEGLDEISFEFLSGRRFLNKTEISMLDHPGEYLKELPDALEAGTSRPRDSAIVVPDGGTFDDDNDSDEEAPMIDLTGDDGETPSEKPNGDTDEIPSAEGSESSEYGEAYDPTAEPNSDESDGRSTSNPTAESESDPSEILYEPDSHPTDENDTDVPTEDPSIAPESDGNLNDDSRSGSRTTDDESESIANDGTTAKDSDGTDSRSGAIEHDERAATDGQREDTDASDDTLGGEAYDPSEDVSDIESDVNGSDSAQRSDLNDGEDGSVESEPNSRQRQGRSTDTDEGDLDADKEVRQLAERVRNANKLILLIDIERVLGIDPTSTGDEGLKIEEYNNILGSDAVDFEKVVLVASKADLLLKDWKNELDRDMGRPRDSADALDSFTEHVNSFFTAEHRRGDFETLMEKGATTKIHPVYVDEEPVEEDIVLSDETIERISDETVTTGSEPDESASTSNGSKVTKNDMRLVPVGFGRVLDEIAG